jgi:hypothetical protein
MIKMIPRLKASIPIVTMAIIGCLCVSCTPTPSEISRTPGGDGDVPPASTLTPGSDVSGEKRPSDAAIQAVAYLVRTRRLDPEVLEIHADHRYTSHDLNQVFQAVTIFENRGPGHTYHLFVNLETGYIFDNFNLFKQAEVKARVERYGKLDPSLFDHLKGLKNDEIVDVAIWVSPPPEKEVRERENEIEDSITAKYPAAREAQRRQLRLWDVPNPELSEKIHNEYLKMKEADVESRISPLHTELSDKGFDAFYTNSAPVIYASLPKQEILSLSRRDDISTIYLNEPLELIQW